MSSGGWFTNPYTGQPQILPGGTGGVLGWQQLDPTKWDPTGGVFTASQDATRWQGRGLPPGAGPMPGLLGRDSSGGAWKNPGLYDQSGNYRGPVQMGVQTQPSPGPAPQQTQPTAPAPGQSKPKPSGAPAQAPAPTPTNYGYAPAAAPYAAPPAAPTYAAAPRAVATSAAPVAPTIDGAQTTSPTLAAPAQKTVVNTPPINPLHAAIQRHLANTSLQTPFLSDDPRLKGGGFQQA